MGLFRKKHKHRYEPVASAPSTLHFTERPNLKDLTMLILDRCECGHEIGYITDGIERKELELSWVKLKIGLATMTGAPA